MKKSITLMLLLMMAGSASADLVVKTKGRIAAIPNILTTSGKTVFCSYDSETEWITVYSPENFEPKTFNLIKTEYQSGSYTEEGKITPTGMNVVLQDRWGNKNYNQSTEFNADSQDEMMRMLKEEYSYKVFTAFTDPFGNPACYDNNSSFKYEDLFGKQYPTSWYALIDGMVYCISVYNSFYEFAYDEESAVWTRTSENITTRYARVRETVINLEGSRYDPDGTRIYITQSLFNDDNKWEYMVPEYGPMQISSYNNQTVTDNGDGTVTLVRTAYVESKRVGYGIYNEDGTRLYGMNDTSGEDFLCYFVGDKRYFKTYEDGCECLYEFKKGDGDMDFVEVMRAKSDRRLETKRGIVTVNIDAEQAGGEVVVSTTDGKVMANKKVGVGQTQINDQPLPTGIYVVSLLKDGKVLESEKYLVQ